MQAIECPYPDCSYITAEVSNKLAITLLQIHAPVVATTNPTVTTPSVRVEKVRRPTMFSAGPSENWSYCTIRWQYHVESTQVTGKEKILQLLEFCDEELRKDLTRSAGGSLTNKTEAEVLAAMRTLAVREENIMVARVALYEMR